jgi:hypothetical protein
MDTRPYRRRSTKVTDEDKIINPYWDSSNPYANHTLLYSEPLVQLLVNDDAASDQKRRPFFLRKLVRLLRVDLEDPNKMDDTTSAVALAIKLHDIKVVSMVFAYGGRPNPGLVQFTKDFQMWSTYDLIVRTFSKPSRPLPAVRVDRVEYESDDTQVTTKYRLTNNETLYSTITDLQLLSSKDKKYLGELFGRFFSGPNVVMTFNDDFTDNRHKLVEIIWVIDQKGEKNIVGFLLFEIFNLDQEVSLNDLFTVTTHCLYMLIRPEYRDGIMNNSLYRVPCATFKATGLPVEIFFCAKHLSSFLSLHPESANNLDGKVGYRQFYFPQYLSESKLKSLYNLVKFIYKNLDVLEVEGMKCSIIEPDDLQVVDMKKGSSSQESIYELLYRRFNSRNGGVPVILDVSKEFVNRLTQANLRVGIHFENEVERFYPHFKKVLSRIHSVLSNNNSTEYPNNNPLFLNRSLMFSGKSEGDSEKLKNDGEVSRFIRAKL